MRQFHMITLKLVVCQLFFAKNANDILTVSLEHYDETDEDK